MPRVGGKALRAEGTADAIAGRRGEGAVGRGSRGPASLDEGSVGGGDGDDVCTAASEGPGGPS